jgi:ATP-binding cassette subfamily B (MDR/TAP) protein 1
LQLPISTLDGLPPGQTTAIVTITANISERLSSLIQAVAVILIALLVGCVFSWELTLVTFTGLIAIVGWYAIITPLVAKRYADVQIMEREAAGVAAEALSSMKMIAACGAEAKIANKYDKLVDHTKVMSKRLSPVLALQHSPGMQVFAALRYPAYETQYFSRYLRMILVCTYVDSTNCASTFALCFWFATKLYLHLAFKNVETLVV